MKHLSVTVPKSCSENWDNFTPSLNGHFCSSCKKTVIDFSGKSDDQIFEFFQKRPEHTCGRFRSDQLKIYTHQELLRIRPGMRLVRAGLVSLLLMLVCKQISAQTSSVKAQSEFAQHYDHSTTENNVRKLEHLVRGIVIFEEDNLPAPGVNVWLKGSTVGTTTDINGEFRFPQKLKEGDVLFFSFIGYDTQEYKVPKDAEEIIEIKMSMEYFVTMGEVVVGEVYVSNPSVFVRLWQKVKEIF